MAIHTGENPYIYGLHDPGGEHLMIVNGEAKGWTLVTEAIGAEANERGGGDYTGISNQGIGVIIRLNQSYGENGTIPREARYPEFAQRVANYVQDSKGANIWLIGNEMNFFREQPRKEGSSDPEIITPRRYATCYKMCRQKVKALPGHENDLVVTGSPAPWNNNTSYEADPEGKYPANPNGDWVQYLRDILLAIGPDECDAISIHTYSHGYDPALVTSEAKMDPPFDNRHYNFYAYRDQMEAFPENMRHLPVYLTEANGDREEHAPDPTWPYGNNGWIKAAYDEINKWNTSGQQQIRCMVLFRWMKDDLGWSIDGKPEVQQDFQQAVAKNHKWNPEVGGIATPEPEPAPVPEPTPPPSQPDPPPPAPSPTPPAAIPQPAIPEYRTRYLSHNTPTNVTAKQTLNVTFTLQNAGSTTWVSGGDKPFRLGFKWFNEAAQQATLPPELDFRTQLPQNVQPNQQVTLQAQLRTPDAAGTYQLRWDMVHELVAWFIDKGDAGLLVSPVAVAPAVEIAPVPTPTPTPTPPAPTPAPTPPVPTPTPTPVPEPAVPAGPIQIQNVINQLPRHPTRKYLTRAPCAVGRLIVHHTASDPSVTVQNIAQYHVNQGLPGASAHFYVAANGIAYQAQPLTVTGAHAGQLSRDSIGVSLIGNFMQVMPTQQQLDATASVLAQIANKLELSENSIVGLKEIAATHSPGATWPQWKPTLLAKVRSLIAAAPKKVVGKPIQHYMLLWHKGNGNWAEWELRGALDYISKFPVTIGFSVEEAKLAKAVTIVGGPDGIPAEVDDMLRAAGCKVDRLVGATETDTRRILRELAAQGKQFLNLK